MSNMKTQLIPSLTERGPRAFDAELDSIGHSVRVARATGIARDPRSARIVDHRNRTIDTEWTNGATLGTIDRWLSEPRSSLVAAVEDMKRRIEDVVEAPTRERRRVRRNREDGDELDPQAVLERRADGWSDVETRSVPKHTVVVAINLSVSAFRRPEDLLYRGAAAAAVADLLTQSGHSVEVVGFVSVGSPSPAVESLVMRVPLKRADAPMDLTSLSVAAAEIGFFRTVLISCIGRVVPGVVCYGFGRVRGLDRCEVPDVDILLDSDLFSERQVVSAVRSAVAAVASKGGERR